MMHGRYVGTQPPPPPSPLRPSPSVCGPTCAARHFSLRSCFCACSRVPDQQDLPLNRLAGAVRNEGKNGEEERDERRPVPPVLLSTHLDARRFFSFPLAMSALPVSLLLSVYFFVNTYSFQLLNLTTFSPVPSWARGSRKNCRDFFFHFFFFLENVYANSTSVGGTSRNRNTEQRKEKKRKEEGRGRRREAARGKGEDAREGKGRVVVGGRECKVEGDAKRSFERVRERGGDAEAALVERACVCVD